LAVLVSVETAETDRNAPAHFRSPWWYHPSAGLLGAGLVLVLCLTGSGVATSLAVIVVCTLNLVLSAAYERATGVSLRGFQLSLRSLVSFAFAVVIIALAFGTRLLIDQSGALWLSAPVALAVFAGSLACGRLLDRFQSVPEAWN